MARVRQPRYHFFDEGIFVLKSLHPKILLDTFFELRKHTSSAEVPTRIWLLVIISGLKSYCIHGKYEICLFQDNFLKLLDKFQYSVIVFDCD